MRSFPYFRSGLFFDTCSCPDLRPCRELSRWIGERNAIRTRLPWAFRLLRLILTVHGMMTVMRVAAVRNAHVMRDRRARDGARDAADNRAGRARHSTARHSSRARTADAFFRRGAARDAH